MPLQKPYVFLVSRVRERDQRGGLGGGARTHTLRSSTPPAPPRPQENDRRMAAPDESKSLDILKEFVVKNCLEVDLGAAARLPFGGFRYPEIPGVLCSENSEILELFVDTSKERYHTKSLSTFHFYMYFNQIVT